MFQLNFSKKLLSSPIFPDEVLQPFGSEGGNEAADAEVSPDESEHEEPSQEVQSDEQTLRDIISPKRKAKAASGSRKRQLLVSESDDEDTPSPCQKARGKATMPAHQESVPAAMFSPFAPLAKKRKAGSAKKGLKVKMTTAEIRHFYSFSSEEG